MSDVSAAKLFFVSLGCDKNLVDSERMLAILTARGFELTDDEYEADAAVVNTCCFIEDAKKESIEKIFDLARLKEEGKLKALVAAGCMAQRYRDEILEEIPELDAIVGTTATDSIAKAVEDALKGTKSSCMRDIRASTSRGLRRANSLRPCQRRFTTLSDSSTALITGH